MGIPFLFAMACAVPSSPDTDTDTDTDAGTDTDAETDTGAASDSDSPAETDTAPNYDTDGDGLVTVPFYGVLPGETVSRKMRQDWPAETWWYYSAGAMDTAACHESDGVVIL